MKKLIIAAIGFFLFSCTKQHSEFEARSVIGIAQCKDFKITSGKITCCLDAVIEDSRCPANANCVWAGFAAARFMVKKGTNRSVITLMAKPDLPGGHLYPTEAFLMGVNISFDQLNPYPGLDSFAYKNYQATITVKE